MKKTKNNKTIYFAIVLVFLFSLFSECCFAAKSEKIAIMPFTMNSDQNLSFLQNGIFDMLSSRLSDGEKVSVLTRDNIDKVLEQAQKSVSAQGKMNRAKAQIIGANLGVEYVLFGSLTVIGESVSLDAQMIDVAGDKPDVTFSNQTEKLGGVIPLINLFARDVNEKIFNRDVGREREQRQQQYAQQQSGGQYPVNQDGYYDRDGMMPQQGYYASPFGRFRTLQAVKGEINGIAVGDVNGDKRNEVVVIYGHTIEILEYTSKGALRPIETIKDSIGMDLIGVDIADVNNNGYAEIFVTRSKNKEQEIESFVIEFDGKKFNKSSQRFPWYFKVVKNVKGEGELYAQKNSRGKGPFGSKKVFRVDWAEQTYVQGEQLRVPKGFSITSLVAAENLLTHGSGNHVFTDQSGRLTIFDESGAVQFVSEKHFGGSTLFYELPKLNMSDERRIAFIQPGNVLLDMDQDGNEELVVIKNLESADYLFTNTRNFKSGSIEILEWNELGLAPKLAPKKLPGQITSIKLGDYDNDSKQEMLVAFVKKTGGMFTGKTNSLLIAYELLKVKKPPEE
ncbi:MAG: VCBS repeat-containing protein [Desulfobacteraceae bacterium]|nr:VCBS repeat-containing protein [Desulfobacteraceae bacterium]